EARYTPAMKRCTLPRRGETCGSPRYICNVPPISRWQPRGTEIPARHAVPCRCVPVSDDLSERLAVDAEAPPFVNDHLVELPSAALQQALGTARAAVNVTISQLARLLL